MVFCSSYIYCFCAHPTIFFSLSVAHVNKITLSLSLSLRYMYYICLFANADVSSSGGTWCSLLGTAALYVTVRHTTVPPLQRQTFRRRPGTVPEWTGRALSGPVDDLTERQMVSAGTAGRPPTARSDDEWPVYTVVCGIRGGLLKLSVRSAGHVAKLQVG